MKHPGINGFQSEQAHLKLGIHYGRSGNLDKAIMHLNQYVNLVNPDVDRDVWLRVKFLLEDLEKKAGVRDTKHALLVGIDRYPANDTGELATEASADLKLWETTLKDKMGFGEITILQEQEATKEAIMAHLSDLANKAQSAPAFFCFAGMGTIHQDQYSILAYDWTPAGKGFIQLGELASQVKTARHLTSVIEAGFDNNGDRFFDATSNGSEQDLLESIPDLVQIGQATFYPGTIAEKEIEAFPELTEMEEGGSQLSRELTNYLTTTWEQGNNIEEILIQLTEKRN